MIECIKSSGVEIMDIKHVGTKWRYFTYFFVLIFLLMYPPNSFILHAQEAAGQASVQDAAAGQEEESAQSVSAHAIDVSSAVITINNPEDLSALLAIEPGSTRTVLLLLTLDTDTFRQLKVIFPQIKGLIHLDMSGCTLAKGTVSLGGTFKDCVCLLSVSIPEGILYSGDEVFMGCKNLQSVQLPESLQIIFSSAFSGCSSLESLTIPPKVTTIGKNAFLDCSKLPQIILPEKVSGIGTGAFAGCTSLTEIVVTSKSRKYTYVSGILFEQTSGGKALHSYIRTGSVPVIPPDVITIYERAFYNNTSVYSVIIPDTISSIGDEAFAQCAGLVSIEIGGGVSFIGRDAFKGCTSLQEIVVRKQRKIPSDWDKNWIGGLLYGLIKFVP